MRFSKPYLKAVYTALSARLLQFGASGAALVVGVMLGGLIAYLTGTGGSLFATPFSEARPDRLRGEGSEFATPFAPATQEDFAALKELETLRVTRRAPDAPRPRIAIIIDDMGLDKKMFEQVNRLPGPLTLSFLPYARDVQPQVDRAKLAGHQIMLHLPMEPIGSASDGADPGPGALLVSDRVAQLERKIAANLDSFEGYVGVNNHMGSRLTADPLAMATVLRQLDGQGLFFLDSITSDSSRASAVAKELGQTILQRDVFLDADHGENGTVNVKKQLQQLEDLARIQGQAIAIAHPYATTIEALGPWLVTAQARGFDLVPASALLDDFGNKTQALSALR